MVALGDRVSPADLLQGRSPTLDLDSLYGAGPTDPVSAEFYADDRHLKMGKTVRVGPDAAGWASTWPGPAPRRTGPTGAGP